MAFRIPRSAVKTQLSHPQVAAYYLSCSVGGRGFHTHITAVLNPDPDAQTDDLYRVLPDVYGPTTIETYMDPNYVAVMMHCMGEFLGQRSQNSPNRVAIEDSKTVLHVDLNEQDMQFWSIMDETVFQIADVMAAGTRIEYLHDDGTWRTAKPESVRNDSLVHEAGTLWMGETPQDSVTDTNGRLYDSQNVYVVGGATFPTCGDWNPTFTGVALTHRLARCLANGRPETGP
jgi:choline dehydrogenase-like flavoprotein